MPNKVCCFLKGIMCLLQHILFSENYVIKSSNLRFSFSFTLCPHWTKWFLIVLELQYWSILCVDVSMPQNAKKNTQRSPTSDRQVNDPEVISLHPVTRSKHTLKINWKYLLLCPMSGYHVWNLLINIHKALSNSVLNVKAKVPQCPIQGEGHLTFIAISLICMIPVI